MFTDEIKDSEIVLGCDCIENEYPHFVILFKKDGVFKKYIALPTREHIRHNFTESELKDMDFLNQFTKEEMIMKLFKMEHRENYSKKSLPEITISKE